MAVPLQRWSANFFCVLGLGLALHLALLKLFALPCIGATGCDTVIHSGYGAVFGIPVGVYAAVLWTGAILVRDPTKRALLLLLLSLGSLAFMGIQFGLLHGFCLYCTAHAVCSWLAFYFHHQTPSKWGAPLAIVLALGGFQVARLQAAKHAANTPAPPSSRVPLAAAPSGVAWLGPITPRSPALVLSLNCAACLDLLEELSHRKFGDDTTGPAVFFKTTDENRELTTTFVAAVAAQPGNKREAFLAATALLLTIKDQALSAPAQAAKQLDALFPSAAPQKDLARQLLATQSITLTSAGLGDTTPLLVPLAGKPRPFFKLDELFGH